MKQALPMFLLVACSGVAGVPRDNVDGGADAPGEVDVGSKPRSAECLAIDAKMQTALDKGIATLRSPDGVIAITTPTCGYSEYFSGTSGLTGQQLFRIGSNTKTFVAGVILKLATSQKLALDDVLEKYVPGIKHGTSITVRQLLNHSSGIFNYTDDSAIDPTKEIAPAELVALAQKHDPYFEPGKGWRYSNTNYILLGMIAEQVGGRPLAELIRSMLLQPLKLEHTFLDGSEALNGTIAKGYGATGKDVTTKVKLSWLWAAGAMVSTPSDLVRWIHAVGRGEPYAKAEHEALLTGISAGGVTEYGLGVFLFPPQVTGRTAAVGHGGDVFGCHSQTYYFPKSDITIVTITNKDGTSPNALSLAAFEILDP